MSEPIVIDQEMLPVRRVLQGWGFVIFRERDVDDFRLLQTAGSIFAVFVGATPSGASRLEVEVFDGEQHVGTTIIERETHTIVAVSPASESLVRGYAARVRELAKRGPIGQLRIDL